MLRETHPASLKIQNANHARSLTGTCYFGILGFVLPIGLATAITVETRLDWAALLAQVAVVLYSAARLAGCAAKGTPDWFVIVLYGYTYTWLGITPLLQYLARENPLDVVLSDSVYVLQSAVVLIGLIAFDVVYGLVVRSRPLQKSRSGGTIARNLSTHRVVLLGLFAVASTPVFVQALGGFDVLFTSRQARTEILFSSGLYSAGSKASGAILTSAASVIPFVAMYAMTFLLIVRKDLRRKVDFVSLYLAVLGCNVILNNPISSSRFWFLVIVLSLCFIFPWSRSIVGVRVIIGVFVAGSLFLFPYLDVFRYSDGSRESRGVIDMILDKSDYDSMVQVGNSINYSSIYGHSIGENFLGAFLFWVPRGVWPSKPIDTGSALAQFVGYHHENLSAPLWAEGYWAFGVLGVAAAFSVLGYVCGKLVSIDLAQNKITNVVGGWSFVLAPLSVYVVLILRGSLLQSMSRLFVLVLILFFCTAIIEKKSFGTAAGDRAKIDSERWNN